MSSRTCTYQGCKNKHYAKGFCKKHYQRNHKHGDPSIILRRGNPQHGTANMYHNHRCRCKPCTKAWADYTTNRRHITGKCIPLADEIARRRALPPPDHGTDSRYSQPHKCRCNLCREAANEARRIRRLRAAKVYVA